jgi:ketosteroid isomerase-like protein
MDNLHSVRRITALLPVPLIGLAVAGCGGADQSAQVRATVVEYGNAVAAKDYAKICRLFAPSLLQQMASINLPCKTALAQSSLTSVVQPTLKVLNVKVTGQSAVVKVHTGAANQQSVDTTLGLVKIAGGGWRLASLTGPVSPSK